MNRAPHAARVALGVSLAIPCGAGPARAADAPSSPPGSGDGKPGTTCAYDPDAGRPNPLGERAFVRVEQVGPDAVFTYDRLPSIVRAGERVTIEGVRKLVLYGRSVGEGRELLLAREDLVEALLGEAPPVPWPTIDGALSCR